jgi:hypothetical protein
MRIAAAACAGCRSSKGASGAHVHALVSAFKEVCCYTEPVFLAGVCSLWKCSSGSECVAVLVYMAAPHHQRLIGDRPSADKHPTWD